MVVVGIAGGLGGVCALDFAPIDDLSPLNIFLLVLIAVCGNMWTLLRGMGA